MTFRRLFYVFFFFLNLCTFCPSISSLCPSSNLVISHRPLSSLAPSNSNIFNQLNLTFQSFAPFNPNSTLATSKKERNWRSRKSFFSVFFLLPAENTGTPGPPLPADVGSWEAIGGARQSLAAPTGIRTGGLGHFLFVNLWRHWRRGDVVNESVLFFFPHHLT